jgi:hypothetical protein
MDPTAVVHHLCSNFLYQEQFSIPKGGSMWNCVRNVRCATVIRSLNTEHNSSVMWQTFLKLVAHSGSGQKQYSLRSFEIKLWECLCRLVWVWCSKYAAFVLYGKFYFETLNFIWAHSVLKCIIKTRLWRRSGLIQYRVQDHTSVAGMFYLYVFLLSLYYPLSNSWGKASSWKAGITKGDKKFCVYDIYYFFK